MVRPIGKAPICLYLEKVAVHTGYEALVEVDDCGVLIVGDLQEILDQQPWLTKSAY
jgi:hypothetical protein